MSQFFFITDLNRFMMKEVEKLIRGSVHEDDFFIVHDASVLMPLKERIIWKKENSYLHCWLLPMIGLYYGTTYYGCPIGNSPKFMPLDNILNMDILYSLHIHCVLNVF